MVVFFFTSYYIFSYSTLISCFVLSFVHVSLSFFSSNTRKNVLVLCEVRLHVCQQACDVNAKLGHFPCVRGSFYAFLFLIGSKTAERKVWKRMEAEEGWFYGFFHLYLKKDVWSSFFPIRPDGSRGIKPGGHNVIRSPSGWLFQNLPAHLQSLFSVTFIL